MSEHPPMKVVRVVESHACPNCGAVCPSCLRTDEKRTPDREVPNDH